MIPKIVHYCWFGRGPIPARLRRCMRSWRRRLPGWEIVLWNEDNFDVEAHIYTREAYAARKFAFVSDFVRLWVLERFGGVYMDTDVEMIRPLDDMLGLPAFAGFERADSVSVGLMGSEAQGAWVAELMDYYRDRHFLLPDGTPDLTPNVKMVTQNAVSHGIRLDNTRQTIVGLVTVFPIEVFIAKDWDTGQVTVTPATRAVHHFEGSWMPLTRGKRLRMRIKPLLHRLGIYKSIEQLWLRSR